MKLWRRLAFLVVLLILTCRSARAQSTTVSGQVTDASSQAWFNGSYQFTFYPAPGNPGGPYYQNGQIFNTAQVIYGALSGTGTYSASVPSSTSITPAGSSWNLLVCPAATPASCYTQNVVVTGSTQTVNLTPPAITVSLASPQPVIVAYALTELVGGIVGNQAMILTTSSTASLYSCVTLPCGWQQITGGGGSSQWPNITSGTNANSGTFAMSSSNAWDMSNAEFLKIPKGSLPTAAYEITNQNDNLYSWSTTFNEAAIIPFVTPSSFTLGDCPEFAGSGSTIYWGDSLFPCAGGANPLEFTEESSLKTPVTGTDILQGSSSTHTIEGSYNDNSYGILPLVETPWAASECPESTSTPGYFTLVSSCGALANSAVGFGSSGNVLTGDATHFSFNDTTYGLLVAGSITSPLDYLQEGSLPSGVSGYDVIGASSSTHTLQVSFDGSAFFVLPVVEGTWTNGDCAVGTATTGYLSFISCSNVSINGSSVAAPNFNGTTPSAPSGDVNCTWQVSGSSVSCWVPSVALSGLTTDAALYGATSTTIGNVGPPSGAGSYFMGWSNSCSGGATAPIVMQAGMPSRELSLSGAGDTVACTDVGGELGFSASATANDAVTLPIPTTSLGNGNFYFRIVNRNTTYAPTITPTTWTIAGGSSLTVPSGTAAFIYPDETASSGTNWAVSWGLTSLTASGDLSNSYPNPTVNQIEGGVIPTSAELLGTNSSKQLIAASALSVATVLECSDTSGSGTAQSCTTSPSFTVASGVSVWYTTTTANTGTGLTVNVDSLGAKSVAIPVTGGGYTYTTTLTAGTIPANTWLELTYSGTTWNVVNGVVSSGGGGGSGTVSNCSTQYALAYYAVTGTTVTCNAGIVSDANDDLTITNLSTTSVPLTVNAITGQTGDLEDWKVNGSTKFSVLSGGSALTGGNYECTASCFLDSTSPTATITIGGGSDGTSSNLGNVSLLGETNSSTGSAGSAFVAGGQNTSTGKQGFTQVQVPAIINTALTVAHELVCPTSTKYVYAACTTSQTNWAGESEATGTGSVNIVSTGTATVVFDGTPTVGDFVCVGTTTAGYAHDNGSTTDCVGPARVGYVNGDVSGSGSGATATVLFARGGLPGTGTQYGITDWATATTLGTVGPASGYAGVAQSLSCITGDACTIGPEGVGVDTQSGSTYTIALTDRLGLVNLTNDTTSTAVTVPQSGSTNFDQYFGFAAINSGTVVATLTPTTSNVNGNTTLKIPAYIGSGYQPAGVLFYGDNENYHAFEISQKDANGLIPNPDLTNSSVTVATDAPLSGGGTVSLGSEITLTITCSAGEVMAGATPACTATPTLGASGTAGTLAMYPSSGNFTTTLGSAATASNTVDFFASAPSNHDLIYCATSSTTCTLTDAGYAYNAIPLSDIATGTDNTLIGYSSSGVASDVTIGSGLTLSGGSLSCSGCSGGTVWSSIGNAAANLTLSNAGYTTTFDQTSAVDWLWANTTTATSSTTNESPILQLAANYWTGSASSADTWSFDSSLAAGTNGASTLTISHSGSSGAAIVDVPALQATGTTAGFIDYPEGSTSASVAPCNATTSICVQAPTAVTSYLVDLPSAASSGVRIDVNASNVITEAHSGDSSHALDETSKTAAITTTTLCAATAGTACGQTGQYRISYNFWGSGTACSSVTAGSVGLNLTWTDENGTSHSTITMPMAFDQKAGAASTTFAFNTALGTEGAAGSYVISTNGTVIQFATTYTACTTGTGTYNLRLAVEQLQ